jgi:hypothetical protein
MKVRELKEMLNELGPEDDDRLVILSKDSEGNGFSPLYTYSYASFDEDEGEIGLEELTEEDIEKGYNENDLRPDGIPSIILWAGY